jgi:hypothetical protein
MLSRCWKLKAGKEAKKTRLAAWSRNIRKMLPFPPAWVMPAKPLWKI